MIGSGGPLMKDETDSMLGSLFCWSLTMQLDHRIPDSTTLSATPVTCTAHGSEQGWYAWMIGTYTLEAVRCSVNGRTWRRGSTIRGLADAQFLLI